MRVLSRLSYTLFSSPFFLTIFFVVFFLFVFIGFSGWLDQKQEVQGEQTQACLTLNKEQALQVVKDRLEVVAFTERMAEADVPVFVDGKKENDVWYVQVAEQQETHLASFNHYQLDTCGKILCQMAEYDESGEFMKMIDQPC